MSRRRFYRTLFLCYLFLTSDRVSGRPIPSGLPFENDNSMRLRTHGDLIFGGIFPMHEAANGKCGAVKEEKGIQRLEAMLWAIDQINKDPKLLPNLTIGTLILDSCSTDTYALEQSMEFVKPFMNLDMSEYTCDSGKKPDHKPHKRVAGVIGASFSVVSIMVANILRLFKIPQLSYASTSTELSDKSRFEYFSRVVPPDNFQAQAMVEIVQALGWKYVSTVAVEGDYGEKGIASFLTIAQEAGICIAMSEKIARHSKEADFDRIIEKLSTRPNARGVIIFVDEDNTRKLLQATVKANKTGHFHWIGSDSWGAKHYPVRDQEHAAEGAITVLPRRSSLADFDKYFQTLRPVMDQINCNKSNGENYAEGDKEINCRNIWFREFWKQHHGCVFESDYEEYPETFEPNFCTGMEEVQNFEEEGLVPFVVDAVYAMAHAVHNLLEKECGHPGYLCDNVEPVPPGPNLLKQIRNVSFIGRQGTEVRFNEDGDAYGSYTVFQYQKIKDKYDYVEIGAWKEKLTIDMWRTRWRAGENKLLMYEPPRSICSNNCPNGYIRNFMDQCCWSCVACKDDAYSYNDTCVSCRLGWAPNANKTDCEKLTPQTISWLSPWAFVPLFFSAAGIVITVLTGLVFIKFSNTPIIMASGRELCYVLLIGIISCYGMPYVVLSTPTILSCTVLRLGLGLCLSLCYSSILTKTNRISRIFNRGAKSVQRPRFTSPRSQVAITLVLVSCQLVGATMWVMWERPKITEIYPSTMLAILTCAVSTFSLLMSLVFNMILILLCTLYAFKTRKIPENFNEAKYIGFTMYSTCIVWLAFIPIYFGTNNDYEVQIASLCMCVNISATVALGCLFTPKLYIVLFQPSKNVRQPMMLGGARPGYSMKYNPNAPPSSSPMVQAFPAAAAAAAAMVASSSSTASSGLPTALPETTISSQKEEPPDT